MIEATRYSSAPPISRPLAAARITVYVAWTLVLLPVQIIVVAIGSRWAVSFPAFYHRNCLKILGIDLVTVGKQSRQHPTLYVANHCSYLDISVYGTLIKGAFVAKREVAGWPLFGLLAKLQRTVFIDRDDRRNARAQAEAMAARLARGDDIILFPEGTSGDGNRVLPFHSSLLVAAEGDTVIVQPVTLTYTQIDGRPMGRDLRPFIAWYGDMEMASHMFALAGLGRITARVEFHEPVTAGQFATRKALTDHCFAAIAKAHANAINGRAPAGRRYRRRRTRTASANQ